MQPLVCLKNPSQTLWKYLSYSSAALNPSFIPANGKHGEMGLDQQLVSGMQQAAMLRICSVIQ